MKAAVSTNIALALVGQGKPAEARQVIAPVVKLHRDLASRNRGDEMPEGRDGGRALRGGPCRPGRRASLLRGFAHAPRGLPGP